MTWHLAAAISQLSIPQPQMEMMHHLVQLRFAHEENNPIVVIDSGSDRITVPGG